MDSTPASRSGRRGAILLSLCVAAGILFAWTYAEGVVPLELFAADGRQIPVGPEPVSWASVRHIRLGWSGRALVHPVIDAANLPELLMDD